MEQIHIQENCLNSNLNNVEVDQGWWKEQATDWSTCNIYSEGGYHKTSNKCPPTFITPWGLEPQHLLETRHLIEHWPRAPWVYYVICSGFMLSYSSCYFSVLTSIYLFLKKTGITCANTKYLGSYDVTNVWLVLLTTLCHFTSPESIWDPAYVGDPSFIRTQASDPRHLLAPGAYSGPGVY